MEPPTIVIFRKWRAKPNAILALFPALVSHGHYCESYALHEGHGGADYIGCISRTRPASPDEYADTKATLERNYGYNLKVQNRYSH